MVQSVPPPQFATVLGIGSRTLPGPAMAALFIVFKGGSSSGDPGGCSPENVLKL